jgi:lipopolysaccharide export system protein LptC
MTGLTTTTIDTTRQSVSTGGHSLSDRQFSRAMRHSRLVRSLRVAAPVLAAVLCVLFVAIVWFDPIRALKRLPQVDHVVVSGTKITMAAPKLSGFTRDQRKYDLAAHSAVQDVTNPDILELEGITAKFETEDNTKLDLTASTGVFLRKTGMLTLRGNVVLVTSSGYQVNLDEVKVDTTTNNIVSEKPVEVKMLQGTVNANRLEVVHSGDVITFDRGVKMLLLMNEDHPATEQPAQP